MTYPSEYVSCRVSRGTVRVSMRAKNYGKFTNHIRHLQKVLTGFPLSELQLQNVNHCIDVPRLRLLSHVPQAHLCGQVGAAWELLKLTGKAT